MTTTPRARVRTVAPDQQHPAAGEPLHIRYRPKTLDEVLGQDSTVKSLREALTSKALPHSYLFTGPAGTGKTTLARIVGHSLKVDPANVIEVDAASTNGIDSVREITAGARYQGFGATPNKLVILDECHRLTKPAWEALLKSIEEPPPHVFYALCTTEPDKVPATIVTRCLSYHLKPVRYDDLLDLLDFVMQRENLDTPDEWLGLIARAANGSPRQALVMLALVQGADDADEVRRLLEVPTESKEVIDLCRMLVARKAQWPDVTAMLRSMDDPNPESVRIVVTNYLAACLLAAKTDRQAQELLDMVHAFRGPFNPSDKLAPLLLAFGAVIYP